MPSSSEDAVAQIKARLDLREIVSERVKLRRQGREWTGLCPFHQEDSPSFTVNAQSQVWYCFGCQRGGDLIAFVEQVEKTDFQGALALLAERAGIDLDRGRMGIDRRRLDARHRILAVNEVAARFYEQVLHGAPDGAPGLRLLEERGVDEEVVRRFGLGYAAGGTRLAEHLHEQGVPVQHAVEAGLIRARSGEDFFSRRLVIPIRDERGQTLAFTARTVDADVKVKYVNSPETAAYVKGRVLFALDIARPAVERRGHAVLMEGQFDVIAAHRFGIDNAIASSGTALTDEQLLLLKRFTDEVVLAFDSDQAGRAAALRAVPAAARAGLRVRVVEYSGAKDPDELLRAAPDPARRWQELLAQARQGWEFKLATHKQGLNPSHPRDVEIALSRIRADLKELEDPAIQELYLRSAAEWLGLAPAQVAGSRPFPAPGARPRPPGRRPVATELGTLTPAGVYLLQVLAVRPEAAARVRVQLDPDDLAEGERVTYLKMLEVIDRGGLQRLSRELPDFDEKEQDLIRRAWVSPPPSVEDEVVESVVRQLRRGALDARLKGLRGEILKAEREGDMHQAQELQGAHARLSRDLEAMKRKPTAGLP